MEQKLDPWKSSEINDYSKLIDDFGISPFGAVADKIPNPHKYMKRGVIFGHRDFERIAEAIAEKKPFVVLDGFMPTGKAHFGHKMVMDQIIWYQENGGIVVVGIADIEAHAVRGYTWEECKRIGVEEYLISLIALGLKPENTRLYFQSENQVVKDLSLNLGTKVNFSELSDIYGFSGETHLAHMIGTVTQCADILHSQMPFHGGPIPVVVPVGADQDPHIRLTRDIAAKMNMFIIERRLDQKGKQYWSVRGKNAPEKALKEIDDMIQSQYGNAKTNNVLSKKNDNNVAHDVIINDAILGGALGAVSGALLGSLVEDGSEDSVVIGAILVGAVGALLGSLFGSSIRIEQKENSINIYGKIPENNLVQIIDDINNVQLSCGTLFSVAYPISPNGVRYLCITDCTNNSAARNTLHNKIKSRFRSLSDNILFNAPLKSPAGMALPVDTPLTKRSKEHIDIFVDISENVLKGIVGIVEYNNGGYTFIPPSSTYHRFMTGLTGGKMSSSIPDSNIALSEDPKSASKKIMKAKTGGRMTVEEQKESGGDPSQCSVYEFCLFHLMDDDNELRQMENECRSGEILCGECKKRAAGKMEVFLTDLRKKREEAYGKLPLFGIDYKHEPA